MIEKPNPYQYNIKKKFRKNDSNNCRQTEIYGGTEDLPSKIERGIWKTVLTYQRVLTTFQQMALQC